MKLYKIGVIVGCLLLAGGSIKAQSVEDKALQELRADSSARTRFITRATMYGVGFTNVFDTYLSPQEYKGVDFRISRESMRMTKWMNGNVSLQSFFQADLGYTHNRVTTTIRSPVWQTGITDCIIIFRLLLTSNYLPEDLST